MKLKRILCLCLCAVMILGAMSFAVFADTKTSVVLNVCKGDAFTLPATVLIDGTEVAVTGWTDASGEAVTDIDTSKIGYRTFTGAVDGGIVSLRVNVGEKIVKATDNMENHTAATNTIDGVATPVDTIKPGAANGMGLIVKGGTATDPGSGTIATVGTDTEVMFGDVKTPADNLCWYLNPIIKGETTISLKVRVKAPWAEASSTTEYSGSNIRVYDENGNNFVGGVMANMYKNKVIIGQANGQISGRHSIDWGINVTKDGDYAVSDEFELSFNIHPDSKNFDILVNGKTHEKYTGLSYYKDGGSNTVRQIRIAQRTASNRATVYYDDLTVSQFVCFDGELSEQIVTANVRQGTSGEQVALIDLPMSDGNMRAFEVKFTPDLEAETVNGTIEGFDGFIPVTCIATEVINDDFQEAELGALTPDNPLNGWTVTNTKGTVDDTIITFEKEDYPNHHFTSNNVLKINRTADDTEASKDYVLRRELPESVTADDADVMSVKFNIMRNNNNTIKFTVGLESEYDGGVAIAPFEFILVASQIYLPGMTTPIYFDGKYNEYSPRVGIWHEFEIVADIKNDYVYFYEQDKLLGSVQIEDAAQKIYGLSAITLESDSTGNGSFNNGGGFIWIDNIKVELFTEQQALKEAGSRLESLFRGRISDDINLPAKGWYETNISWESDADAVDATSGIIKRPESGGAVAANMTATVSKAGLESDKFYYTALINPLSVVLDESFEFPRTVNGQAMSKIPLTGGLVPWHGWTSAIATTQTNWDTSATIVEENESNKAFRLGRLSGVSTASKLYSWTKMLTEPVNADERASVSFRVKRESGLPEIRMAFGEGWITDVRLSKSRIRHEVSWPSVYFGYANQAANIDEWYNFDFLVDFPTGKCYAYCDEVLLAEGPIPEKVTSFDLIMMTPTRSASDASDSKMLIDDIVVNKLSETELNTKMNAYADAVLSDTLIKDVSISRGKVNAVTIKNRKAIDETSRIIVAEYDRENKKLQKIKIYDIPEKSNVKYIQTVDINQTAASGNKVKVFVWDNSVITPLAFARETMIP